MTTFLSTARLVPPALRPVVLEDVPDGWEQQVFESARDGDPLTWLGFEPGEPVEPLLPWSRPSRWPDPALARPRTA